MELYHLAVLLCLALFVRDGSATDNGQDCSGDKNACEANNVCGAGDVCKWKLDQTCTTAKLNCVGGTCTDGTKCSCPTDASGPTVQSSNKEKCLSKVGVNCAAGNDDCVPGAECGGAGQACACTADYVAKTDNTKCLSKVGKTCAVDSNDCVPGAECAKAGAACACKTGYVEKSDNSACSKIFVGTGTSKSACKAKPILADEKCQPKMTCESVTCKWLIEENCKAGETSCADDSTCASETAPCKCPATFGPNKAKTVCVISAAGTAENGAACDADPKLATKKCKESYSCVDAKCKENGAAGMAASLLLVVSAFLTSRFL